MAHHVAVDVKETKVFCDKVFVELADMKKKLEDLRTYVHEAGEGNDVIAMYERHLGELIYAVEWKIQVLSHSCPQDWKGSEDFDNDVQVDTTEQRDRNFSPGYTGG